MIREGRTRHLTRLTGCAAVLVLLAGCAASGRPDASETHEPTPTLTPAPSVSQTPVTRADYLAQMARMFRVEDPPTVEVVRVIEPEEALPLVYQCLSEAGFPVSANGAISVPNDQLVTLNLNYYICFAKYPVDERYLQPMTADQHRFVRTYVIESAIPCLAGLGYSIAPPPTEETYLESVGTSEQYSTSSELSKLGLSSGEIESAITRCPETPPAREVYRR